MRKIRHHRLPLFTIRGGIFILLAGLAISWFLLSPVSAAPTTNIVYSTDGGSSWSSSPTVKSGQEIVTRAYFNNDSSSAITDAQLSAALPSGFVLKPSSTRTCLNPGTTDPATPAAELVCNTDSGQGGAINEGAVWSGSNLTVAPNAGLYGEATNATGGLMAAGKKRYLNLHQCARHTNPSYDWITVAVNDTTAADWYAGTNASNTADATYNCGPASGGWTTYASISSVQNLDLLGKRYANVHQCMHYYSDANGVRYLTTLTSTPTATNWATGTNMANTANGTVSCAAPGSGWTFHANVSDVQPLDTLNNRYANIHECVRTHPSGYYLSAFIDNPNGSGWRTGTNVSNTADTVLDCPVVSGWTNHSTLSDFQVVDTLDTARGQGFVEYKTMAPAVTATQTFNQTATLTGSGTGSPSGNGSIVVEPDIQLVYSTDGGATWTTDPVVEAGANVRVRLFSHNKRDQAANTAQFSTALPAGFTRVPGSTRVCLSPGTTDATNPLAEKLCNNDAGQGGAINEGAVWSGSDLAISPTAGLFGQPAGATSGYLAAGKDKNLNLHQCVRYANPSYDWITVAVDDPIAGDWYAGTNASNTADSTYDCGAASWATHTTISDVQNLDLFGKRYANLHQCAHYYADATNGNRWINTLVNDPPATQWGTSTNTSNVADSAVGCNHPSGWTYYPSFANVQPLDMLTNRYVNIHECVRTQPSSNVYVSLFVANPPASGWATGTKASNTPDTALSCPAVSGWTTHSTLSDYQVIDTLDINRGQVFVEFDMTAPSPQMQTDYMQTAALTGTSTGDESADDTVTVLVDPGVIITQTGGSTDVTEGGASDTIYAQLTAPPSSDVTLTFTDDNGQLVTILPVTFTSSNWDTPQPVTITAIDDNIIEGPHTDYLNYTTSSSDTGFNGLSGDNVVTVNITDNDAPGANVVVTDDITSEDGDTGEFCITLSTQPSADVTIALSSSDINEASVPPSITILAANWNNMSANCVTVTGEDDGSVGDSIKAVTITTGNVTSSDPNYNALDGSTIADVTVYNQNNDPPGFRVTVTDGVTTEDGGTATVEFRLLSQPDAGADVTIPLSIDDPTEGTLNGVTSVTITNADWNVPQSVTITGVDDDFTDGDVTYHLVTGDPTSTDPIYDAFTGADIVDPLLTNIDTDVAGVTVTQTGGSTNVTEGGATDIVNVVLNTRPAPGNTVVVTVQPQPQLSVGAGSGTAIQLTFDTNNWNVPQPVTVSADDDNQLEGAHTALIQYLINTGSTTEHSYKSVTGIPATTVNITDNDTATAGITKLDDAAENPANNGHFRVSLSKPNSTGGSPITVNYTVSGTATAGSDYIPLSGSVAVPSGASSADIAVDVTGMDDDLLEGTQTVIVTLTGTNNPQVSIDGAGNQATVGISDDEVQTASASLQVAGNGSETGPVNVIYQVVLTNQNETGSPISFTINPAGGSAAAGIDYVDFSGQTISVPNGATSGTRTVNVIDNNLVQGPRTVRGFVGNPSLTGLAISNTSATAIIADNDSADVTITATDDAAIEGTSDGGEFTVNLSALNSSSDPLIVTYEVSGSATAGTDYAPLTGQVEIPVGADSATIAVDTSGFDDTHAGGNRSVTATLTGTDNTSFILGTPVAAVVVITDPDTAPPEPQPQPQPQPTPPPAEEAPAPVAPSIPPLVTQNPPAEPQPTPIETPEPETPLTDTDHDGVPDEKEDQALNGGDGNGDGVPDKDEDHVVSLVSPVTGKPVTLAVEGDCRHLHGFDVIARASVEDPDYIYPQGLFDFEVGCGQSGQSAQVTMYLDTTDHGDWTWRKFNRFGLAYATVGDRAEFGTTQIGNATVTTVKYQITDGGDLDEDGAANGIILDPSGPGVQTKGYIAWGWWLLLALPTAILWILYQKRKSRNAKRADFLSARWR